MAVQVAEECEEEDADVAEDDSNLQQVVSHMLHFACVSSGYWGCSGWLCSAEGEGAVQENQI